MKKIVFIASTLLVSHFLCAASIHFSGSVRTEGDYYYRLGLGNGALSKFYNQTRILLKPHIIIDDHFTVHSQWNLLTSPRFTPDPTINTSLPSGQGGYILGDTQTTALVLNRVWLEWTSDFGIFRIGRMPFEWGYGLIWDAGNEVWNDFQTTMDRLEYRLQLGHLIGGLAYSKLFKNSVLDASNDQQFYSVFVRYDNPENDVEWGLLYERQARVGQDGQLTNAATGLQVGVAPGFRTGFPSDNHLLDIFVKKSIGHLAMGAEGAYMFGSAADFTGDGTDSLSAWAVTGGATYSFHKVKATLDAVFASGDTDVTDNSMNGFVLLHRNKRPGIILGHELLGNLNGNTAGMGSILAYAPSQNVFSGVFYVKPGFSISLADSLTAGLDLIYAMKVAVGAGDTAFLGFETDANLIYSIYKNFDVGLNLGYLFPGAGLGVTTSTGAFGVRTLASIKF